MKTCDERSMFAMPIISFLNINFHDFSVKNYLILYAKQNKSGSERSVSVFNGVAKLAIFCLKQGRGLKASEAQLCPDFPSVPPGMSLPRVSLFPRELPFFLALSSSWLPWFGWIGLHKNWNADKWPLWRNFFNDFPEFVNLHLSSYA